MGRCGLVGVWIGMICLVWFFINVLYLVLGSLVVCRKFLLIKVLVSIVFGVVRNELMLKWDVLVEVYFVKMVVVDVVMVIVVVWCSDVVNGKGMVGFFVEDSNGVGLYVLLFDDVSFFGWCKVEYVGW